MSNQDEKKLKQMKLVVKTLGIAMAVFLILSSVFLEQLSGMVGNNLTPSLFPYVKYILLAAGVFDIIYFAFVVKQ